jgi:hypothetical protein
MRPPGPWYTQRRVLFAAWLSPSALGIPAVMLYRSFPDDSGVMLLKNALALLALLCLITISNMACAIMIAHAVKLTAPWNRIVGMVCSFPMAVGVNFMIFYAVTKYIV